jgi:hypothetical protein
MRRSPTLSHQLASDADARRHTSVPPIPPAAVRVPEFREQERAVAVRRAKRRRGPCLRVGAVLRGMPSTPARQPAGGLQLGPRWRRIANSHATRSADRVMTALPATAGRGSESRPIDLYVDRRRLDLAGAQQPSVVLALARLRGIGGRAEGAAPATVRVDPRAADDDELRAKA